jgi:hypothetical protein
LQNKEDWVFALIVPEAKVLKSYSKKASKTNPKLHVSSPSKSKETGHSGCPLD